MSSRRSAETTGRARPRPPRPGDRPRRSRARRPRGARSRSAARGGRSSRAARRARRRSDPSRRRRGCRASRTRGVTAGRRHVARHAGAGPSRSANRTVAAPAISIAVPQTSPSPCAKCRSPIEKSAPGTSTGQPEPAAGDELPDVHVPAELARRDRPQAVGRLRRDRRLRQRVGDRLAAVAQLLLAGAERLHPLARRRDADDAREHLAPAPSRRAAPPTARCRRRSPT